MHVARIAGIALALLCLSQAHAGGVYRCKAPHGGTYYSDKGCDVGDPAAKPRGDGNVSVIGTGKFKPSVASPRLKSGAAAAGAQPVYRTQNRYTRRAEGGAARADQALKNK